MLLLLCMLLLLLLLRMLLLLLLLFRCSSWSCSPHTATLAGITIRPGAQVINITDVDDKIVARAAAEGVSAAELTDKWEQQPAPTAISDHPAPATRQLMPLARCGGCDGAVLIESEGRDQVGTGVLEGPTAAERPAASGLAACD